MQSAENPVKTTQSAASESKSKLTGLTVRAALLGALFAVVTVWLVSYAELVSGQIMIGYLQAPPVAVFLLFLVASGNYAWSKARPNSALKPGELATIYAMMVPAAMVASHGMLQRILPVMAAGNYYANRQNGWVPLYFPHTPAWIVAWDPKGPAKQPQILSFYQSLERGQSLPWTEWIRPLFSWLMLFALVYSAFLAMATILRKQWVENERLTFPLIQLPLDLIGSRDESAMEPTSESLAGAFFKSKLAWGGFALPFVVFAINGLHHIWPVVPLIPLTYPLSPVLKTPPWNGVSYMTLNFSFAAVGFFFLLPTEMLFSLWFFYVAAKAEEIIYAATGNLPPEAPHADARMMIGAQTEGAWVALVLVYLTMAKPHLKSVWKAVVSRDAVEKGQDEMMSYRTAFWLLLSSFVGIIFWCVLAGMSAWLAVAVFGLYIFVQAIIMARSTAEGGLIMTEGCWTPSDIVGVGVPLHSLGQNNLTMLCYIDAVFTRDLRSLILTAFLDMQKLAERVGLKLQSLRNALILSLVVSVVFGCALQIWLPYHHGANNLYDYMYDVNATQFFHEYASYMKPGVPPPSYGSLWYALLGAAVTIALGVLRAKVSWWPLHPLGYALSGSWTVVVFWVSMLVAWIIKSSVLRYGGIKIYRLIRPFFIGMILGELSAAGVWTLIASFTQITAPQFPWP